ncbi:hypothetical protein MUK42_24061 [Musa troglodytarum]|uniref:Uncharacterized protein n=1 Tax=Musa troglodytarum TaxID=320322 RepID=A0A9E7GP35_9LILI|nr:hypothetical protein MUK42_24061 [Musa troglodytarum]URE15870.1 hypothetical protein MUK42_24061 [Musa troglodytarum]URE15871.1 hypothetical protein MUK42_24061 [Musa troglodytarum]URE15872.1 hypothetical protein MUK42_24061 [Musa troglodytarum]URE15873.1 hypothetical protein MUK42_24061 [Musa troglodytarum]
MERCMKQYDKDYMEMKTIMLKQEETFRHQVHELHRLYQIQKLLMRNTKTAAMNMRRYMKPDIELWNVENETPSHRNSHGRQPLCSLDLEAPAESIRRHSGDEESDLELTLATGSSRAQRKRKDASFTSDSGSTLSSSSIESGGIVPDISTRFRNERKSGLNIEEQMRQDAVKQPPWLFQCTKQDMVTYFGL